MPAGPTGGSSARSWSDERTGPRWNPKSQIGLRDAEIIRLAPLRMLLTVGQESAEPAATGSLEQSLDALLDYKGPPVIRMSEGGWVDVGEP